MRKILALCVATALLTMPLSGCGRAKINKGLPAFEDNTIMRAAWWCPSPNEQEYTLYRDAGLNTVLLVNHNFWRIEGSDTLRDGYYLGRADGYEGQTMTERSLALAKQMGLSVVLSDGNYLFPEDYNVYEKHTIDYSGYEDVIVGVFSGDEPSLLQISDRAANIQNAKQHFPNVPYFCNLFPMYADKNTLKTDSYSTYLNTYGEQFLAKTTAPRLLSVDFYPYISTAAQQYRWLLNYRMVAEKAAEYDADTHFFIQPADGITLSYDLLTQEMVRQQVNVALAYGADAYSYYLYQPAIGGYNYGLVEGDNLTPSRYYQFAKTVNAEAASVEQALLHYDWVSTHPVTNDVTDFSTGAFLMLQRDTREELYEQATLLTKAESDNRMLVTLLRDDDGNEAYYVVNYFDAYDDEQEEAATVTLTFDGMKQVAVFGTVECKKGEVVTLTDNTFTYTLSPGDACLVVPYY